MPIKKYILQFIEDLNIKYKLENHPPVYTVDESLVHLNGRHPIKNLLLTDRKKKLKILVIMSGKPKLDTKKLAKDLDVPKLQFASKEMLMSTLGVESGPVSLFSLIFEGSKGVRAVIDKTIIEQPEIGFHPNDNSATIFIQGKSITNIIKKTGHRYQILEL